jgi:hypothetical protein
MSVGPIQSVGIWRQIGRERFVNCSFVFLFVCHAQSKSNVKISRTKNNQTANEARGRAPDTIGIYEWRRIYTHSTYNIQRQEQAVHIIYGLYIQLWLSFSQ